MGAYRVRAYSLRAYSLGASGTRTTAIARFSKQKSHVSEIQRNTFGTHYKVYRFTDPTDSKALCILRSSTQTYQCRSTSIEPRPSECGSRCEASTIILGERATWRIIGPRSVLRNTRYSQCSVKMCSVAPSVLRRLHHWVPHLGQNF